MTTPVRTDGARCGASKTPPPHRRALAIPTAARSTKRTPHGCAQVGFDRPRLGGRVVPAADAFCSPLGVGQHPKTAPRRHTALPASLFLLLKGCTIGHIAPPPTGSRAGARRGRLGARTARKVRTSTAARPPQGCRTAVLASQGPRRAPARCSGCCAGGCCAGRCCAGWRAVRPPAAAAPAPSLAGAVAPRAPNSAGTRHESSHSRGEQAVLCVKRARSRTFKAGSGLSKGIPLRNPSVPPS